MLIDPLENRDSSASQAGIHGFIVPTFTHFDSIHIYHCCPGQDFSTQLLKEMVKHQNQLGHVNVATIPGHGYQYFGATNWP